MSRKHFVAIAAGIAAIADSKARKQAAYTLADTLASTNPRFNRARFLAACGLE